MGHNKKLNRLQALTQLIQQQAIEDQDQLVDLLKKQYNIETNQSIISRDLRMLGAVKRKRNDTFVYEIEPLNVTKEILHRAIIAVEHNQVMIVVKTLEGLAAFVGDYLDQQQSPILLATLAGENIVLVIPTSIEHIEKTYQEICNLLHYKDHDV